MFRMCKDISYSFVGRRYFSSELEKSTERIPVSSWLQGYQDPKSKEFGMDGLKRDCLWIRKDIVDTDESPYARREFVNFNNMKLFDIASNFGVAFKASEQFDAKYTQPQVLAEKMTKFDREHFKSDDDMNRTILELMGKLARKTNYSGRVTPSCRSHGMRVATKEMIEAAKKQGKQVETPFILSCDHSVKQESSIRELFKLDDKKFEPIVNQLSEREKHLLDLGLFKLEKLVQVKLTQTLSVVASGNDLCENGGDINIPNIAILRGPLRSLAYVEIKDERDSYKKFDNIYNISCFMENKKTAVDCKGQEIDSEQLEAAVGTANNLCLHGFSINYLNELKELTERLENKDESLTAEEIKLVKDMGHELLKMKYLVRPDNSSKTANIFGRHFLGLENGQSGSLLLSSPYVAFGVHGGHNYNYNVGSFDNYFSWITARVIECVNQAARELGLL